MAFSLRTMVLVLLLGIASFQAYSLDNALKIKFKNITHTDETVVRFLPGCTYDYDMGYDAQKLFSQASVPVIYSRSAANLPLSINALPALVQDHHLTLQATVPSAGIYELVFIELGAFSSGTALILEDKLTGEKINARTAGSYSFNVLNKDSFNLNPGRFVLHAYIPAEVVITDAVCDSINSGCLKVSKTGTAEWTAVLANSMDSTVYTFSHSSDSLSGIAPGYYTLKFMADPVTVLVTPVQVALSGAPVADFSFAADDIVNEVIYFSNNSSNSGFSWWEFGDGSTSTLNSPSHTYLVNGSFSVKLTVTSGVCQDTLSQTVIINSIDPTSINAVSLTIPVVTIQNRSILVKGMSVSRESFSLYTLNGQLVAEQELIPASDGSVVTLVPASVSPGAYIYNYRNSSLKGTFIIQ